jgi:hypothetical protein
MDWTTAGSSCKGEWRLPNLRELHELYKAMGGSGSPVTDFDKLKAPNSNPGNANALNPAAYWSNTESDTSNAYYLYFQDNQANVGGSRGYNAKTTAFSFVRCVREL